MGVRVLVIDDDEDIREALDDVLTMDGYDVVTACDGREGLDRLHQEQDTGLILLDLMMPGMNGWEFRAQQLQEPNLATIPVVVISADRNASRAAQALGAAAYLNKPVELEELLQTTQANVQPGATRAKVH